MISSDTGPATNAMQDKVLLAARLLVAPLFIYSGIGKILAFGVTASRLPGGEGGFGSFLAAGSIVIELGCSLALILGIYTRCAALALIVFTILASVDVPQFLGLAASGGDGPDRSTFSRTSG